MIAAPRKVRWKWRTEKRAALYRARLMLRSRATNWASMDMSPTCLVLGSRLALVQIANFSVSGKALPLRQPQWQGIWMTTWMLSMRKPIGLQLRCHLLGRKLVFLQFPTSALLLNQKVRCHLTAFLPFGDPCCSEFMKYVKTIVLIYTSMVAS